MLSLTEYSAMDAVELADKISRGELSRQDVLETSLRAIDAVNGELNAIIALIDPPVSERSESNGRFSGVPYLLKDIAHGWSGVRSDMGSRLTEGYIEKNASVFGNRSRGAGLVAIGRTNTPEFGMNATTEPVLYGATSNPWDVTRTPGGSSGGSAAAVAAGVVPMAYANDGGGSIRLPAAWCGLVGLKPSRGTNPGHDATGWILAEHVVSRTVRDTAAMLDVTAGSTHGSYVRVDNPGSYERAVRTPPRRLKIGVSRTLLGAPDTHEDAIASVETTMQVCEQLGHEIRDAVPAVNYRDAATLCLDLYTPCIVPYIDALARVCQRVPGPHTLEPPALTTYRNGMSAKATDLIGALSRLETMSTVIDEFMEDIDVWLMPAVSQPPCANGQHHPLTYRIGDTSFWHEEMDMYAFMPLPSITGQPALVLPLQGRAEALPTGVQLVAAQRHEVLLFQLAGQLEREMPWAERRPGVHVSNFD